MRDAGGADLGENLRELGLMADGDPFDFASLPGAVREVWKDGARVRPRQRHLASA